MTPELMVITSAPFGSSANVPPCNGTFHLAPGYVSTNFFHPNKTALDNASRRWYTGSGVVVKGNDTILTTEVSKNWMKWILVGGGIVGGLVIVGCMIHRRANG